MKQLTLFETLPIESSIKPGDWVKLRRKSNDAAHWKKGEIVEVESVHPRDGSIRFWNDRVDGWGYLYPDEIVSVQPPADSVEPIALGVDSLTLIALGDDSLTLIALGVDSLTPIALGDVSESLELIALGVDSLTLIALGDDSLTLIALGDVSESKPVDSLTPINAYKPGGSARNEGGNKYFRFTYRSGNKVRHRHIPGGNTDSIIAQDRVEEIQALVAGGASLIENLDLIESWSDRKKSL